MRDTFSPGGIAEPDLSPDLAEAIIDTVREPLVVLTADLVVQRANEVFYETFGLTSATVVGQRIYDLAGGQWDLPELRDLLESVLPHNEHFEGFALEHDFPEFGLRSLVLNARRIDHLQLILLAFEDVTERKRIANERARLLAQTAEQLNELETLYETAPIGLGLFDREHRFRRVNRRLAEINGILVEEQMGRVAWDVLPTLREPARPLFDKVIETGEPVKDIEIEAETPAMPGVLRQWLEQFYPLKAEDGTVLGVGVIVEEITERRRAEQALRESEFRLRLALESAQMGAWEWDMTTDEATWDAFEYELLGHNPEDQDIRIARDFLALIHPEDREELEKALDDCAASGDDFSEEFRIMHPAGEERWLAGHGRIIKDPDGGRPRMIGLNWDITERKNAERRQEMLTSELHHRVKNLLATVQATMMQTIRHTTSLEDFETDFTGRLQALGRGHDILMRGQWEPARLSDIVAHALGPYSQSGQVVLCSGADIALSSDAALAFNLIIHELATNAAKYGALSSPGGSVEIDCRTSETGAGRALFRWRDKGGPAVEPPSKKGFGTSLIEVSAIHDLRGAVDFRYHRDGLECEIRFATDAPMRGGGKDA